MSDGISVVVCTYDDPVDFVNRCLDSMLSQEKIHEILVVDSSREDSIKKLCSSKNGSHKIKIRYIYMPPRGLSEARNEGIRHSEKDIVAFTDPDCIVSETWADAVCSSFSERVAVVGGKVLPKWLSKPSRILLNSAIAQGFYSFFDIGNEMKEVEQVFGADFAIRKSLTADQYFLSQLGRKKENLLCGEEIDFCRRVRMNGFKIIYNPSLVVWHQIPEERTKFGWTWRRMYYAGITRAMLGGRPTPRTVNHSYNFYDAAFLMIFIIPYMYGLVKMLVRRF